MVGKLWWNLVFAAVGAVLVFLLSITNNTLQTTIIRAVFTFVIFFLILFLFRYALNYVISDNTKETHSGSSNSMNNADTDPLSDSEEKVEDNQQTLSDEEAKKTSEMIRSLLSDENDEK